MPEPTGNLGPTDQPGKAEQPRASALLRLNYPALKAGEKVITLFVDLYKHSQSLEDSDPKKTELANLAIGTVKSCLMLIRSVQSLLDNVAEDISDKTLKGQLQKTITLLGLINVHYLRAAQGTDIREKVDSFATSGDLDNEQAHPKKKFLSSISCTLESAVKLLEIKALSIPTEAEAIFKDDSFGIRYFAQFLEELYQITQRFSDRLEQLTDKPEEAINSLSTVSKILKPIIGTLNLSDVIYSVSLNRISSRHDWDQFYTALEVAHIAQYSDQIAEIILARDRRIVDTWSEVNSSLSLEFGYYLDALQSIAAIRESQAVRRVKLNLDSRTTGDSSAASYLAEALDARLTIIGLKGYAYAYPAMILSRFTSFEPTALLSADFINNKEIKERVLKLVEGINLYIESYKAQKDYFGRELLALSNIALELLFRVASTRELDKRSLTEHEVKNRDLWIEGAIRSQIELSFSFIERLVAYKGTKELPIIQRNLDALNHYIDLPERASTEDPKQARIWAENLKMRLLTV